MRWPATRGGHWRALPISARARGPDGTVAMGQIASDQRRARCRPSSAAGLRHCSLNEVHQAKGHQCRRDDDVP
jgi:hypothetical protein